MELASNGIKIRLWTLRGHRCEVLAGSCRTTEYIGNCGTWRKIETRRYGSMYKAVSGTAVTFCSRKRTPPQL